MQFTVVVSANLTTMSDLLDCLRLRLTRYTRVSGFQHETALDKGDFLEVIDRPLSGAAAVIRRLLHRKGECRRGSEAILSMKLEDQTTVGGDRPFE